MNHTHYSSDYDKLHSWLKQIRAEQGLTLRGAAKLVARHHLIIGKIEQERKRIDIGEYVEYCLALEADPHEDLKTLIKSVNVKPKLYRPKETGAGSR